MAGNPFSPFVDLRKFLWSFIEVDVEADARYSAAAKQADDFQQRDLSKEARQLLIKHADGKYDERVKEMEHLDKKREWLITFSMGAVTFLVGAQRFSATPLSGTTRFFFCLTVVSFLFAVLVLLLSRRVRVTPVRFTIQHLREGLAHAGVTVPEDWLAASLHKTCEALRVHQDAIAAQFNCAICFVFLALFSLMWIAILGTGTRPAADQNAGAKQLPAASGSTEGQKATGPGTSADKANPMGLPAAANPTAVSPSKSGALPDSNAAPAKSASPSGDTTPAGASARPATTVPANNKASGNTKASPGT